jgi:sulfite exporter TauE/SafE
VTELLPLQGTALLTGILGSAHCLGMCGGISGLYAMNGNRFGARGQLPAAITYNLGRLTSYALLGLVVATFGHALVAATPDLASPVRFLTGALIVMIGLQVAFNLRLLRPLEMSGAVLWRKFAPAARRLLPATSLPRAFALGLLWGWLPCGLIYSVLLLAATSASPLGGATTMIAFGLGTMPAMVLSGVGAAQLARISRNKGTRVGLGLLIVLLGALTLALPIVGWLSPDVHGGH